MHTENNPEWKQQYWRKCHSRSSNMLQSHSNKNKLELVQNHIHRPMQEN